MVHETNALSQTIPPISALLLRRQNSSTTDNDDEDWGGDEPKKIRVSNPAPIVKESTVLTQTAPTNVIAGVLESEVQILYFYCFAFRLKILQQLLKMFKNFMILCLLKKLHLIRYHNMKNRLMK